MDPNISIYIRPISQPLWFLWTPPSTLTQYHTWHHITCPTSLPPCNQKITKPNERRKKEEEEEEINILSSMFQKCLRKRLRMIIKDFFRPVTSLNINVINTPPPYILSSHFPLLTLRFSSLLFSSHPFARHKIPSRKLQSPTQHTKKFAYIPQYP